MEDVEEYEGNDEAHNLLISALSKLDKTQHIKVPTRREATNLNSEFNLTKSSNRIDLQNVVKVLGSTAQHVQISKNLKKTQDVSKILPKPLEKPQAERLKRSTGYEQTKGRVGRWDPVVARNRTLDCIYFPLKRPNTKLQPTDEFVTKFELKSPLELELDQVDPPPAVEEEEEEEPVYPMTYQEMVEQRKHLAKMRAQQSFKAAKDKRQKKIKSKKYHRILKKEKLKQQLKEFEELQKTDPEEALKKLDALEKERALERHTLRHKNTGKWAKSKLVRAKYDKDVRQQLAEQLSVARSLTKKIQDSESSDEEQNDNIQDLTLSKDPKNPWMLQRPDKSNVDAEFDFGYKQYLKDKSLNKKADSESDSETEKVIDKMSLYKLNFNQNDDKIWEEQSDKLEDDVNLQGEIIKDRTVENSHEKKEIILKKTNDNKKKKNALTKNPKVAKQPRNITATTSWNVESIKPSVNETSVPDNTENDKLSNCFDSLELAMSQKVSDKLKLIRNEIEQKGEKIKTKPKEKIDRDSVKYLEFKTQKKAIIDEELDESTSKDIGEYKKNENLLKEASNTTVINEPSSNYNIDPSRFIQAKPKYLNTAATDADFDVDDLDDSEQVVPKVNIEDVFEDDDVVASFRQEKEDEINKDKPEDIDLSLPGWGQWGGKGVRPIKKRKNRFITKGAVKMPRRDENKGDIIIKEYKDPKLAAHKITDIPFPFKTVKDFEASIRAPLGNTFIPEIAHRNLTKPSKITKAGAIIEPMDEEELLSSKNVHYRNTSVMQLLAKNKTPKQKRK